MSCLLLSQGSYSPKDDCTAALSRVRAPPAFGFLQQNPGKGQGPLPQVKHPPPRSCSFAAREITRSRKVVLAERLREQGNAQKNRK